MVAIAALVVGCGNDPVAPAKTSFEGKSYKGTGYTILFPVDWAQQKGLMGSEIAAIGKPTDAAPDFSPNVNVVVVEGVKGTLDDSWAATIRPLKTLSGFKKIEERDIELPAGRAKVLIWEHTLMTRPLRAGTYLMTHGSTDYVITCTDAPESFDASRATFEEIVASIRFK